MTYKIDDILSVLSESTSDYLCDVLLFTEGEKIQKAKEAAEKVKDKAVEVGNKVLDTKAGKVVQKVGSGAGSVYNAVTETPGAVAAGVAATASAVKSGKPIKEMIPEIQKGFQQRVVKYKASSKVGVTVAVLLAKGLLIGPPDWIITAIMAAGLAKDTAVNRETKRKLNVLKDKVMDIVGKIKALAAKHKDKDSTDSAFKNEYNELLREGNRLASEADRELRNSQNIKQQPVTEAVIAKTFDKYLITENGTLVDNIYEVLHTIIEKTDHEKIDLYPLLDHYFEKAI